MFASILIPAWYFQLLVVFFFHFVFVFCFVFIFLLHISVLHNSLDCWTNRGFWVCYPDRDMDEYLWLDCLCPSIIKTCFAARGSGVRPSWSKVQGAPLKLKTAL